jgi:hypothetical protein
MAYELAWVDWKYFRIKAQYEVRSESMLRRLLLLLSAVVISFPLDALAGYITYTLHRRYVSNPHILVWCLAPLISFPVGIMVGLAIKQLRYAIACSTLVMTPFCLVDLRGGGSALFDLYLLILCGVAAAVISRLHRDGSQPCCSSSNIVGQVADSRQNRV